IAVFRNGERFALAWHLRFDTEPAARHAFEALLRGVVRDDVAVGNSEPPPAASEITAEEAAQLARRGDTCRERNLRGPIASGLHRRDLALVAGPFVRNSGRPRSDGNCAAALQWLKRVI